MKAYEKKKRYRDWIRAQAKKGLMPDGRGGWMAVPSTGSEGTMGKFFLDGRKLGR